MTNFKNVTEFYPTPVELLEKISSGVDWKMIHTVLEPSAGKGNIAEYAKEQINNAFGRYGREADIDCIEKSEELQACLKGKGMRLIHDDFKTFHTYKRYDLIFMNPPFSEGETHLLKALDIQKNGGNIICILNAESIRNPYTNERKMLVNKLEELNADISYMENEFVSSERPTGVEIAVIKVSIPQKTQKSIIVSDLKKKHYAEESTTDTNYLTSIDFVKAIVKQYELEVEAGIKLIEEYQAMKPFILSSTKKDDKYAQPLLTLKLGDKSDVNINKFVQSVRIKYWTALFEDKRITGRMASEQRSAYISKVNELKDYDFSYYNIKTIQEEMSKNLVRGIEDCIISLFDELSRQYSYSGYGTDTNIHYYNGWKTNKSWYINKKVILPFMNAWSSIWKNFNPTDYHLLEKLGDIEKALDYLNGTTSSTCNIAYRMQEAEKNEQTKKIQCRYFTITFYKKGTCHIEFTNEELLKKLNIFGSQQKKWLPPSYGKKTYEEMDAEERAVIDDFEGKESYAETLNNADYFLYDPSSNMLSLETSIAC